MNQPQFHPKSMCPYNLKEPLIKEDAHWASATPSLLAKLFISSAVRQVVVRSLGEQCS
jgi:hypothetical protein